MTFDGLQSVAGLRGKAALKWLVLVLTYCALGASLAACDVTLRDSAIFAPANPAGPNPVQEPTDVRYYPSDEPVRMGLEHFNRGNYGVAQQYFKDAVEKSPRDLTAWSGLAASYDRIRRFDLADQAYAQVIRLGGVTVEVLNNQGYSYMLRGNLSAARRKFDQAHSLDPENPVIANNLELLNGSRQFVERPPNNQP
jgi:tetratricopeptide (TPR) repeat protein